jgi:flagellar L-ring protein precursor FlgH
MAGRQARRRIVWTLFAAAMALGVAVSRAEAQTPNPRNYDEVYAHYLAAARTVPAAPRLWMGDLLADPNARRVNDLVTVRVIESLTATGSADSTVNKASSGDVSLPGKLGTLIDKLLPVSSDTKFNGSGGTTRTTDLQAVMTARVIEVLPNGDLVIQGIREIDINGDRSLVVLTGVLRPIDILPGNIAPSTRIGQLRIQSLSQGLIRDSLSPGWLIRLLNKVF